MCARYPKLAEALARAEEARDAERAVAPGDPDLRYLQLAVLAAQQ